MKPNELHKIATSCNEREMIVHARGRQYAVDPDHILMCLFPLSRVTGRSLKTGRLCEIQLRSIKAAYPYGEAAVPGLRAIFAGF